MKPLGLLIAVLDNSRATLHVDDDYDWYVRHTAAEPGTERPTGRARWMPIVVRLASLARYVGTRVQSQPRRLS